MKLLTLLLGTLFLAACAQERYVLLPDASGQSGRLLVKPRQSPPLTLDQPNALSTSGFWGIGQRRAEADEVKAIWGGSLAATPQPPKKFMLYFLEGTSELTADSKKELDGVFDEIKKRKVTDVVVIGHTDTVGSQESNDRLAEARAKAMQAELEHLGVGAESIKVSGRGEREPLVKTADEVAEPLNRRVEIQVR
ncbi:MAG: OmpA/MotB [Proteobacteria bacterium]|nr:OmpA/MotB [Pseudomonadota bacterium]